MPDFLGDDNQAEGSPGKGSGATLSGGPTATAEHDKDDDDDGFETVDDGEGAPDDPVVLNISMKEVTKLESSGLTGAERMFESEEEEEDVEVQEQIAAALETVDPLDELKLSESSSNSELSSDDDGNKVDLNETKQYYQGPETGGIGYR